MFCHKCGRQLEEAAEFCSSCGAARGIAAAATAEKPRTWHTPIGWVLVCVGAIGAFAVPIAGAETGTELPGGVLASILSMWVGFALGFSHASPVVRWGGGFIAASVLAGAAYVMFRGSRVSPTSAAHDVVLSDLVSAYEQNELSADQRYQGRHIRTRGVISAVAKDILNQPYVTVGLSATVDVRQVQCVLTPTAAAQAAQMTVGSAVTVHGRVRGLMMNILLDECAIVAPAEAQASLLLPPSTPRESAGTTTASNAPSQEIPTAPAVAPSEAPSEGTPAWMSDSVQAQYSERYQECQQVAESTVAMRECTAQEHEAWDARLNTAYQTLMRSFPSDPKATELRTAQRQWLRVRDEECSTAGAEFAGGTLESVVLGNCVLGMTISRTIELEQMAAK